MTSRNEAWQNVQTLEDIMALLSKIENRRHVIRAHAWHGKSMKQIYVEATAMKPELAELKAALSGCWERLHEAAQKGGEG